ncbi:hypothetical protein NPIL_622871 [Nephila pilipes]|uniref:Uncharacterized protein n=1 Tax=Nephila pilipes TaxID=299642 RepID=A0A8X6T662_NEPPI|nr:hypothetical protein NPIL_622871 [Nephila pilipes]
MVFMYQLPILYLVCLNCLITSYKWSHAVVSKKSRSVIKILCCGGATSLFRCRLITHLSKVWSVLQLDETIVDYYSDPYRCKSTNSAKSVASCGLACLASTSRK